MKNYLFDVKLFAAVRIDATNETAARKKLAELFECASASVYDEELGNIITFELSLDDGPEDLVEVDGEPV